MAGTSKSYKFTKKDTDVIVSMGYRLHGITQLAFGGFMHKNYPGFDLAHLLEQVEQLMVPHAVSKVTRNIFVNGNILEIKMENDYTGEDDALIFGRKFYKDNGILKVKHEFLVFPIPARNKGLNKKVQRASLEQYLKMGIEIIEVVAGLSKGAYVWARHGFVAIDPAEMEHILKRAELLLQPDQYDIVKIIYDDYYNTARKKYDDFPIYRWADLPFMQKVLMDCKSQWTGRLDLKNKEQLRKFEEYVAE